MSSNTSSSSQTNAAPSPLDADIVLVDGRKFRKQSVQMSPESSKDKKEAKKQKKEEKKARKKEKREKHRHQDAKVQPRWEKRAEKR